MPRCKAARPTSAATEREPRDGDPGRIAFVATTEYHAGQGQAIRANIIGSDQCCTDVYAVRGASPVLKLCRELIKAGFDPARSLWAYRGDVLCLVVRFIGEGAGLTIDEHNGTRFAKWKPLPRSAVSSPMRQKGRAAQ